LSIPTDCWLGCHVSTAGGLPRALDRAHDLSCTTAQVFVSSNRRWSIRELDEEEAESFRAGTPDFPGGVHAHACYLINLANPEADKLTKSLDTLSAELVRCDELGIPYLVIHPGSHLDEGEEEGLKRIRDGIDEVHDRVGERDARLLIENMAGQGSVLPYRFEQMRTLRESVEQPDRLGYCLDTCHLHASGYDLGTADQYEAVMEEAESVLELDRVKLLHLNDSREEAGSRVDRHEHIGEGTIGAAAFRRLMNDPRWERVPKILETPTGDDAHASYARNLKTLVGYLD